MILHYCIYIYIYCDSVDWLCKIMQCTKGSVVIRVIVCKVCNREITTEHSEEMRYWFFVLRGNNLSEASSSS